MHLTFSIDKENRQTYWRTDRILIFEIFRWNSFDQSTPFVNRFTIIALLTFSDSANIVETTDRKKNSRTTRNIWFNYLKIYPQIRNQLTQISILFFPKIFRNGIGVTSTRDPSFLQSLLIEQLGQIISTRFQKCFTSFE